MQCQITCCTCHYFNNMTFKYYHTNGTFEDTIVTIEEGKLEGKKSQDYLGGTFFRFLGIPYAEPPIGDLRFKAPIPKKPWTGVRKATEEGPPCPSPHRFFQYYVGSEPDCLHLNVFTRNLPKTSSSLNPVMVWIHGGSFKMGCNELALYGPEYLMTEDIVLVVINYRLGIFGFLSLKDPSLGVPGNAGMKDMVLALKWVQRNIEQFCGDPGNVTIFGQSSGAACVHYLCMSPMAKGLFHKAIVQSGCVLNTWALGHSNGTEIAKHLHYKEMEEAKILKYLKKVPPKKLVDAQRKDVGLYYASKRWPFAPVVEVPSNEPAFLTEPPIDIMKKGTFNQVPMIFGYASEEAIMGIHYFFQQDLAKDVPHDLNLKKGSYKFEAVTTKVKNFYFDGEDITSTNLLKLIPLKNDIMFIHGIHRSINYQKKVSRCPIYLYKMTLDTSLNIAKKLATSKCGFCRNFSMIMAYHSSWSLMRKFFIQLENLAPHAKIEGASHSDDVNYLFTSFLHPQLQKNTIEEISVGRFVKLWTNFARTGNPTPSATTDLINVTWEPVSCRKKYFLEIGRDLKAGSNPDSERVKFWDSLYEE